MVLHGTFATYKGKEYEARRKKGQIGLIIRDQLNEEGFALNDKGTAYVKYVDASCVDSYYSKQLVGTYKECVFDIMAQDEENFILYACLDRNALKLDFEQVGKYEFEKKVNKSEVSKVEYRITEL